MPTIRAMRINYAAFLALGAFLLVFCSCNKYDEGPAFSLRTKTFRATNNWVVAQAYQNGLDITSEVRMGVNLKKDGKLAFTDTTSIAPEVVIKQQSGLWEFDAKGENLLLIFTTPGGGVTDAKVWYILRLTTDELWVTETINDNLYRYEFITQ